MKDCSLPNSLADPAESPVLLPFAYGHNRFTETTLTMSQASSKQFLAVGEKDMVLLARGGYTALLHHPYLCLPCTTGAENSEVF